jgi:hypothetical protein
VNTYTLIVQVTAFKSMEIHVVDVVTSCCQKISDDQDSPSQGYFFFYKLA